VLPLVPIAPSEIGPALADHQRRRLREILIHAARTEGHRARLREAGVCDAAGALAPGWLEAFASVEPIHRSRVRSAPGLFLAKASGVEYRGLTSGTRSEVYAYFADPRWNELRQRRRDECLAWWGITAQHPIVNVASRLVPARAGDVAIGGEVDAERVLRRVSRFRDGAFVLRGYPSRVGELAAAWLHLAGRERGPAPHAVICTGEVLYAQQRALISEAFRAPVIDEYGCHETGAAGFSCPEAGWLHLDGVRCLFEQVGDDLVTTDLYNEVLPAVRYLSGDLVCLGRVACPCGREGPTARMLGRTEDRVRVRGRLVPAGAVDLDPLPGVALYRVEADGQECRVEAVPRPEAPAPALLAERIASWARATFGAPARVSFREVSGPRGPGKRPKAAAWTRALLEEEWGQGLLELEPPNGPLGEVARLHRDMVIPDELSNGPGPLPENGARMERLLDAPPLAGVEDELLAARVLLWAAAHGAERSTALRALARLEQAVEGARGADPENVAPRAGAAVDAALLDLEIGRWLHRPGEPPASHAPRGHDALNAHHLLAAIEHAWLSVSPASRPACLARLHPLLPVMISDAQSFAPELGAQLLPVLGAMLGRAPPAAEPPPTASDFTRRWVRFRMALCTPDGSPERALEDLGASCGDARQHARAALEGAYLALCRGELGAPAPWIDLIHRAAPLLGEEDEEEIDLLPWIPLLRALAPELHRTGEPELAYRCLALSTPPSSRVSAFDRLTRVSNIKQAILHDGADPT